MKVIDMWKTKKKTTISFELFPPRSEKAAKQLKRAIDKLTAVNPDFLSVTFGAGGSTLRGSAELIDQLLNQKKQYVLAYFALYGLSAVKITEILNDYRNMGVENLLVVRGDEPKDSEGFEVAKDSFEHTSDSLTFIQQKWGFCLGVAGYPEGHINAETLQKDLEFLKVKVERGADFVITNYFYDNRYFFDFQQKTEQIGIKVPIIPGIMPIFNIKMMENLAQLCGATITGELRQALAKLSPEDKDGLIEFGIEYAYRQCKELISTGVPGIHFYTMDRSKSVVEIVRRLQAENLL